MSNGAAWSGRGYNAAPEPHAGLYLRLREKGQAVRLRLASEPYLYTDTFTDPQTGKKKELRKAAWVAIHKAVVDGKPTRRVVVFQSGPMVLYAVRGLALDPEWGDPTTYDVTITRTEESGRYYTVLPMPKPIGPISAEDLKLIEEANIDLEAACKPAEDGQAGSQGSEYDPFEE